MPHFQQVVWKYYPLPSPKKKLTRKLVKSDFLALILFKLAFVQCGQKDNSDKNTSSDVTQRFILGIGDDLDK